VALSIRFFHPCLFVCLLTAILEGTAYPIFQWHFRKLSAKLEAMAQMGRGKAHQIRIWCFGLLKMWFSISSSDEVRVEYFSHERGFSAESSLQSISSNSFLWKRTNWLVVIQTWSWSGKHADSAWTEDLQMTLLEWLPLHHLCIGNLRRIH